MMYLKGLICTHTWLLTMTLLTPNVLSQTRACGQAGLPLDSLRPCVQRLWDCSWTVARDIPKYELPPSSSSFMLILSAQSSASPYDAENQSVQSDSPPILLGISDWSTPNQINVRKLEFLHQNRLPQMKEGPEL